MEGIDPTEAERLVETVAEAVNRGDAEAVVALSDPEVEFESVYARAEGGAYRGHGGMRRFVADMAQNFDGFTIKAERIDVVGDRIVVRWSSWATGRESGVPVKQDRHHVISVRRGKLLRVVSYPSEEEARAAAAAER